MEALASLVPDSERFRVVKFKQGDVDPRDAVVVQVQIDPPNICVCEILTVPGSTDRKLGLPGGIEEADIVEVSDDVWTAEQVLDGIYKHLGHGFRETFRETLEAARREQKVNPTS